MSPLEKPTWNPSSQITLQSCREFISFEDYNQQQWCSWRKSCSKDIESHPVALSLPKNLVAPTLELYHL
jgi:hypothetical protein